jgi:hypothetical protein
MAGLRSTMRLARFAWLMAPEGRGLVVLTPVRVPEVGWRGVGWG